MTVKPAPWPADEEHLADLRADMHHHYRPSVQQTKIALAMLDTARDAYAVVVPIAAPGKRKGIWSAGQDVQYPPGFFLALTNDWTGPQSYAAARREAEASAHRHLLAVMGVTGYATIHRDGHWSVTEGREVGWPAAA